MHIAIILDGNRRFAKKKMLQPWKGHNHGAEKVEKLFDWCKELNIKELTLYALSQDNLKREKKEVEILLNLFKKELEKLEIDERLEKDEIKIKFIGKRKLLPLDLQEIMKKIQEKTKNYHNYIINFCIAYSGRDEIIEAAEKLRKREKEITKESLQKALQLPSEPDLIIRTGNQIRMSDFLPFQSIYSEWIFLEKLWPEFTKQDLQDCIKEFEKRKRNFGK